MSAFMASCVKLYRECIEAIQPGASALIRPAELPNDSHDVGGNAMSTGKNRMAIDGSITPKGNRGVELTTAHQQHYSSL